MGFSFIMVEKDSRRAMQLTNHHPLGAIDDEGAVICHQRYGAEVNLLLFDIPNVFGTGIFIHIVNDEPHRYLDGCLISHSALQTLLDIIFDTPNGVTDKLQGGCTAEVADREDSFEDSLQSLVDPFVRINLLLQKPFVGLSLHFDEIWDFNYFLYLAETLPDSIVIGQ